MKDVSKIRIGKHLVGIIGLKETIADVANKHREISDDQIGKILLERLLKDNYIEKCMEEIYKNSFMREYKKFMGVPVVEEAGEGVDIKVLGQGCPQCDRLEQELMVIIAETGIPAMIEHVRNVEEIAQFGFLKVPALVINGEIKASGSVPPKEKIKTWIQQAANQNRS
jgi:small redox-active disulfide protein 2